MAANRRRSFSDNVAKKSSMFRINSASSRLLSCIAILGFLYTTVDS